MEPGREDRVDSKNLAGWITQHNPPQWSPVAKTGSNRSRAEALPGWSRSIKA